MTYAGLQAVWMSAKDRPLLNSSTASTHQAEMAGEVSSQLAEASECCRREGDDSKGSPVVSGFAVLAGGAARSNPGGQKPVLEKSTAAGAAATRSTRSWGTRGPGVGIAPGADQDQPGGPLSAKDDASASARRAA